MKQGCLSKIDHLVYATRDLTGTIEQLEERLQVRATPGGQHPSWGTRNALIGLGEQTYLEIIGPDPEQPEPDGPRRFQIDELSAPRLVTWAVRGTDLQQIASDAKQYGIDLGEIHSGNRRQPDGRLLSWRLTDPLVARESGIVPFYIDWGETIHPATAIDKRCSLLALRAEHPDAERVQKMLSALHLDVPVRSGVTPLLVATINTPHGVVDLR